MPHVAAFKSVGRRSFATGLACAVSGILAAPHIARAAVRTIRFGHNNPEQSQFGQGSVAFAKAVAAEPALNGVLTVEVYANAQLGDDVNLLKGCMKATIDGALVGSSIMSNIVPELGIVNAPYLFRDAVQARLVLNGPAGLDFARVSAKNLCQCWPGARTGCVTSPPIGRCERPSICTASRSASHNPM